MSTRKPSLTECIRALRRFPVDLNADVELAEALELTAEVHCSTHGNADRYGRYGACQGCGKLWPCPTWVGASYAAVEWLVAASNEVMRRSGRLGPPLPVGSTDMAAIWARKMSETAA